MNPQVKEKWISALRSGDYQQGTGNLRSVSGYCCLGVLCDLYAKEHNQKWEFRGIEETNLQPQDYWCFGGENKFLPAKVMDWAGLANECPEIVYCDLEDDEELNYTNTVAELNDDGMNFHQIAALIEEQL
jgi:hypothetical protein